MKLTIIWLSLGCLLCITSESSAQLRPDSDRTTWVSKEFPRKSEFGIVTAIWNHRATKVCIGVTGPCTEYEVNAALMLGPKASWRVGTSMALETGILFGQSQAQIGDRELGSFRAIPIFGNLRGYVLEAEKSRLYLMAGVGYSFNSLDDDEELIEAVYGNGAKATVDNSTFARIGAGFDYWISPKTALEGYFHYSWMTVDAEATRNGLLIEGESFDTNPIIYGIGINWVI